MIYAGCSGYSFREWAGSFYPKGTKAKDYLGYYASKLNSVEINHTFRRFPRAEHMASWAEVTPPTFRFSFKMHQTVTHRSRLRDVSRAVGDFVEALEPLGPRLGVVLFQLPPVFKLDLDRLKTFVEELPSGPRYALEFRHDSWDCADVHSVLEDAGVALSAAELEISATKIVATSSFAYVRLRKAPPYTDEEIAAVRALVSEASERLEDVYLYAKHDDAGVAPAQVLEMLPT